MLKRVVALVLASTMMIGMLVGCGKTEPDNKESEAISTEESNVTEESETTEETTEEADPFLTGEKPVLNILSYTGPTDDMNESMITELAEELTGYDVVFHQYDASDDSLSKLMLELSSGTSYDLIMNAPIEVYTELVNKNALMEISDLVDKYGDNLKEQITEKAWNVMYQEDGSLYGLVNENQRVYPDDLTGVFASGISFKNESLKEIGKELPTTLDELYDVLTTYKDATGNVPFTSAKTAWFADIMSAFGMGSANWYLEDGKYYYKAYHEEMVDYLAYVQKLYQEELLDPDMPINTKDIVYEKIATTALCANGLTFSNIPKFIDAVYANNPDDKIVFASALKKDENSKGFVTEATGVTNVVLIPKTAENPEHAMIYINAISDRDVYERIYIGEEGVSFEVKDGEYYPIFPGFDDYNPSNYWVGFTDPVSLKTMWKARARKTSEMAEAYAQMNADANSKDYYYSPESYANSLPEMLENFKAADAAVTDVALKGIVEGTAPETIVEQMLEAWEMEGGLECDAAMQAWYLENQNLFD